MSLNGALGLCIICRGFVYFLGSLYCHLVSPNLLGATADGPGPAAAAVAQGGAGGSPPWAPRRAAPGPIAVAVAPRQAAPGPPGRAP